MNRRAVLSVSNKTGIVEFAQGLVELGFELVSTGGTFKTLTEAGLPVRYVTEITEFPEILDGRVKTLHPKIHGGILARATEEHLQQLKDNDIGLIDLVVVNLYPFKETIAKPGVQFQEAIENIDIGGPSMVRAAAKNQERVGIVVNPQRYSEVLQALREQGEIPYAMRKRLAAEAFAHTAEYDQCIAAYLTAELAGESISTSPFPDTITLSAQKVQDLRYGENPDQKAAFYRGVEAMGTLAHGEQIQGKELSYNNWTDMDAAWSIVQDFNDPACAIIKHTNPCGTALGKTALEAYERALEADPVSAFGGIIAFNRAIDAECAGALKAHFYEVIVAPEFSSEARAILQEKKNLRLVKVAQDGNPTITPWKVRSIQGGYLIQEEDEGTTPVSEWQVASKRQPTPEDLRELDFAWRVVKHVKSNAIVLAKNRPNPWGGSGSDESGRLSQDCLGTGGRKSSGSLSGLRCLFPFPDSLEEAAKAGVRAVVQPGGSVRDAEVIEAADRLNLIMVFTHRRHFKH